MKIDLSKKSSLSQCRLDLWLWAARFFKTRNLASLKIKKGLVRIDGKTMTKPSSLLRIGSKLIIEEDLQTRIVLVEELAVKRVSYEKAKNFFQIVLGLRADSVMRGFAR